MKYIRQFSIILIISFLGELLKSLIPLPIPASIYGLILMLTALCTGIVPLEAVRETGRFLVDIMSLMFIPAAAGLLTYWKQMKDMLFPLCIILVVSTVVVMVVSGRVTQAVIRSSAEKLPQQVSGLKETKTEKKEM